MKILCLFVLCLSVLSCSQYISSAAIEKSIEVCKNNGGLNYIYIKSNFYEEFDVHCKNEAVFSHNTIEQLTKK